MYDTLAKKSELLLDGFSVHDILSSANAIATRRYGEVSPKVKQYFCTAGLARLSKYSLRSMKDAKALISACKGTDEYATFLITCLFSHFL